MQRLFVGIELPDGARRRLGAIHLDYPSARWHPPAALHVTLSFIGLVDEQTAARMAAALEGLPSAALNLTIRGVGYFGSEHKPSVLWAGVEPSQPLLALQQTVEQRLLPCGLMADTRPYRPHVTLARVKQRTEALTQFLQDYADLALAPFPVPHVCLYVSRGGASEVQYEVIKRFSLLKR